MLNPTQCKYGVCEYIIAILIIGWLVDTKAHIYVHRKTAYNFSYSA